MNTERKLLFKGKVEAEFCNIMRSIESHSCDCSLNDTVEHSSDTSSSALNTVVQLKVKKRLTDRLSPWLNNNSVNNRQTCQTAEREWRKN